MEAKPITAAMVADHLPARPADSHKGTYGHLLTVCGSYGMAGAALLCARGALRSGVGLLTAALPRTVYPLLACAQPEMMVRPLPADEAGRLAVAAVPALTAATDGKTAVTVGCGLGRGDGPSAAVTALLGLSCPLIVDADGINALTLHILREETATDSLILTPHPGEMARLLGLTVEEVQHHRRELACRFAEEYGVTLVLKGHHTLVASPGRPLLENITGNAGMATGGSGDVLAGVIGSLAAQGLPPYEAALCGVYIHGAAGDRAAARHSMAGMLPSDLIEELGAVFLQFEK